MLEPEATNDIVGQRMEGAIGCLVNSFPLMYILNKLIANVFRDALSTD